MKIGLALPHYDFSFPDGRRARVADVVDYAQRAERAGFDSVWVSDHLFFDLAKYGGPERRFGTPEAFVMLAAIASATERALFGPLVLNAPLRNPRVLLEQARSIQEFGDGRLELGLGGGWYEPEFQEAGIPFESAGRRIERLRGVLATLAGKAVAPLRVGGKGGPKLMDVIAEHAGGWNVSWLVDPATYDERLAVLADACARHGRDPSTVAKSVGLYTLIGSDDADLQKRHARALDHAQGAMKTVPLEKLKELGLVGTPDACAARIKEFEALGVDEVILSLAMLPFSICDDEQLEVARNELLPLVR